MALSSKDNPKRLSERDEVVEEAAAEAASDPTPSGLALAAVGRPGDDLTDEELNEHAARYQAAKRKARWG